VHPNVCPITREREISIHGWRTLVWLLVGTLTSALFANGQTFPLRLSVLMLAILTVGGLASLRTVELSLLSRVFVVLYSIPFAATVGYLFDYQYVWTHGPQREPLSHHHELISQMLMMAIVGLCGLAGGIEFATRIFRRRHGNIASPPPALRTLNLPIVAILLLVALYLSWLHAPTKTIFQAAYGSIGNGANRDIQAGLNSASLASYLILALLFVDLEQEPHGKRRTVKRIGLLAVTGYIIVVLQFLRGDRECAGLIAAVALLHITSPATGGTGSSSAMKSRWIRIRGIAVPMAGCVLAFMALVELRGVLAGTAQKYPYRKSWIVEVMTRNTWTAVAINNLGLAVEYHKGEIEYLYGRTYRDYILSLPPRALSMKLGYRRPLDGPANPAIWYQKTVGVDGIHPVTIPFKNVGIWGVMAFGGMHPVIVPFKNFGIWGVLPVLFICGTLIGFCEIYNEHGTISARFLYASIATCSMLWFWYADMNLIRALSMWASLLAVHWLASRRECPNEPVSMPDAERFAMVLPESTQVAA